METEKRDEKKRLLLSNPDVNKSNIINALERVRTNEKLVRLEKELLTLTLRFLALQSENQTLSEENYLLKENLAYQQRAAQDLRDYIEELK